MEKLLLLFIACIYHTLFLISRCLFPLLSRRVEILVGEGIYAYSDRGGRRYSVWLKERKPTSLNSREEIFLYNILHFFMHD